MGGALDWLAMLVGKSIVGWAKAPEDWARSRTRSAGGRMASAGTRPKSGRLPTASGRYNSGGGLGIGNWKFQRARRWGLAVATRI